MHFFDCMHITDPHHWLHVVEPKSVYGMLEREQHIISERNSSLHYLSV